MRNLIMAAVVAVTGTMAFGAAAQADTTKVIIRDDHPRPMHRRVVERRVVERDRYHHRDCMTKKVVMRVHGERVVKMTKVCR